MDTVERAGRLETSISRIAAPLWFFAAIYFLFQENYGAAITTAILSASSHLSVIADGTTPKFMD